MQPGSHCFGLSNKSISQDSKQLHMQLRAIDQISVIRKCLLYLSISFTSSFKVYIANNTKIEFVSRNHYCHVMRQKSKSMDNIVRSGQYYAFVNSTQSAIGILPRIRIVFKKFSKTSFATFFTLICNKQICLKNYLKLVACVNYI